jgi:hypothetical protein
MNDIFIRQRRGYDLTLDRLIRESSPCEVKLRCDSLLTLEQESEFNFINLSVSRKILSEGLSRFLQVIIKELNEPISKKSIIKTDNSFYSRQRAFRSITDEILEYSKSFIENWETSIKRNESEKNRLLEYEYRKNIINREIQSRGLKDSFLITYKLENLLKDNFKEDDYEDMMEFSLKFIENQGENISKYKKNSYLLVNDENFIVDGLFPSCLIERLKLLGIIGSSLEHCFMHFPETSKTKEYKYYSYILPKEKTDLKIITDNDYVIVDFYLNNKEFPDPKVAITTSERHDYIRSLLSKNSEVVSLI